MPDINDFFDAAGNLKKIRPLDLFKLNYPFTEADINEARRKLYQDYFPGGIAPADSHTIFADRPMQIHEIIGLNYDILRDLLHGWSQYFTSEHSPITEDFYPQGWYDAHTHVIELAIIEAKAKQSFIDSPTFCQILNWLIIGELSSTINKQLIENICLKLQNPPGFETLIDNIKKFQSADPDLDTLFTAIENNTFFIHAVNSNGETMLTKAMSQGKTELVKKLLKKDCEENSILDRVVRDADLFLRVLALIPENDRLNAIQRKGKALSTMLQRALAEWPLDGAFQGLFNLIPERHRLDAAMTKDSNGDTMLVSALKQELVPEGTFLNRLSLIPKEQRYTAMKGLVVPNKTNKKFMFSILPLLAQKDRLSAMEENGKSWLLEYNNHPEYGIFASVAPSSVTHSHVIRPVIIAPPRPVSLLDKIKEAVMLAQLKYQDWYKLGGGYLGNNGFFTWLRHGNYGQQRAIDFEDKLSKVENLEDALALITGLFNDPKTRQHHHSFASFFCRELKNYSVLDDALISPLTGAPVQSEGDQSTSSPPWG